MSVCILKDFKNASPTILKPGGLWLFIFTPFLEKFIHNKDLILLFTKKKVIQLPLKQQTYPTHLFRFNFEEKSKPIGFAKELKLLLFLACKSEYT